MSNYSLELSFTSDKGGELPAPAVAEIYIQHSSSYTGNDRRFITPRCLTTMELNGEIDRLHEELESIRKRGHARFAAEKITQ